MDKQSVWNKSFKSAQSKGYGAKDSMRIANISASNHKEKVSGTRSISVNNNYTQVGNVMDILIGYPDSGIETGLNDNLDNSGWESFTSKTVRADMEHYNHDFASGVPNNLDEKWQHFLVESEMYKNGNEIRAKVTIPETDLGNEFKDMYTSGQLGTSIEYNGEKNGNQINNWEITNFSFTKDPHYNKTKPAKKSED